MPHGSRMDIEAVLSDKYPPPHTMARLALFVTIQAAIDHNLDNIHESVALANILACEGSWASGEPGEVIAAAGIALLTGEEPTEENLWALRAAIRRAADLPSDYAEAEVVADRLKVAQ